MSFTQKLKSLFKINRNVIKAEVEEIKSLELSDSDKNEGRAAAVLVASAMAACGFPLGAAATPILEKVLAYVIRDAKDGIETPDKLIINRIINEVKQEKINTKTREERLLDELNKK